MGGLRDEGKNDCGHQAREFVRRRDPGAQCLVLLRLAADGLLVRWRGEVSDPCRKTLSPQHAEAETTGSLGRQDRRAQLFVSGDEIWFRRDQG